MEDNDCVEDDVDPNGIRTVKLMTTMPDFLTQKVIKWRLLSCNDAESRLIVRHCQWIKKEMFRPGQKKKTGFRALGEVENSPALERFYVVDCENADRPDEPTAVYECSGPLVRNLTSCCELDAFLCPPDLSWTIYFTHEDDWLGGPFFVRCEWLEADRRD